MVTQQNDIQMVGIVRSSRSLNARTTWAPTWICSRRTPKWTSNPPTYPVFSLLYPL